MRIPGTRLGRLGLVLAPVALYVLVAAILGDAIRDRLGYLLWLQTGPDTLRGIQSTIVILWFGLRLVLPLAALVAGLAWWIASPPPRR